jgi:hypothetical protein
MSSDPFSRHRKRVSESRLDDAAARCAGERAQSACSATPWGVTPAAVIGAIEDVALIREG